MIQYVAHVSVSKKLFNVLLPQNVTILEMSNTRLEAEPQRGAFPCRAWEREKGLRDKGG
nr:hypothetical protein [Nostoc sp. ChiSLP03a]